MSKVIHANQIIITLYIFNNFQSAANIHRHYETSHKVISGKRWKNEENQFMVAVAFHTKKCKIKSDTLDGACHFSCTGSIISSRWVISASHCLGPKKRIDANRLMHRIDARRNRPRKKYTCLSKLNGKKHLLKGITCKINRDGDLEIYPKKVKSYIFVKVTDFEKEYNDLTHYDIEMLVIPRGAYRGGGYKVL
jgi:hypothetical protein